MLNFRSYAPEVNAVVRTREQGSEERRTCEAIVVRRACQETNLPILQTIDPVIGGVVHKGHVLHGGRSTIACCEEVDLRSESIQPFWFDKQSAHGNGSQRHVKGAQAMWSDADDITLRMMYASA